MKSSSKVFFALLICGALVILILSKRNKYSRSVPTENSISSENQPAFGSSVPKESDAKNFEKANTTPNATPNATTAQKEIPASAPIELHKKGALSAQEITSVDHLTRAISRTIAKKLSSKEFSRLVESIHLKPKLIDQATNALGTMVTVRTEDALEGTRYLHAQFTGEKNKADFLEHVSFQIRPGTDSFQKAVEILNQVLPKNKKIKERGPDYVIYNTEDGYVAWVKVATREDLKSNKYNASSKEDVGAVIVTIEQEIHDMDEPN